MKSLTQYFTPFEAAPEDVIVAKVQRLLAGDAKLSQMFGGGDRIESIPLPDSPDFRDAPRLQVFTGAVAEEDQFPGSADKRQVAIIVRIRFDWREWEPMATGPPVGDLWSAVVPSPATIENHVLTVLKAAKNLAEMVNGEDIQLVSGVPSIGPFSSAGAEQDPQNPDSVVFLRDCRALYTVTLDHVTGRILNVVKAEAA